MVGEKHRQGEAGKCAGGWVEHSQLQQIIDLQRDPRAWEYRRFPKPSGSFGEAEKPELMSSEVYVNIERTSYQVLMLIGSLEASSV